MSHEWADSYGVKWQIDGNWRLWKREKDWSQFFDFTNMGISPIIVRDELLRVAKEIDDSKNQTIKC